MVLRDLYLEVDEILVFEDNQGAQHLAKSRDVTQRSLHINTEYHWLREKVAQGEVRVKYCPTNDMIADHFRNPLGTVKCDCFRGQLGVRRVRVLEPNDAELKC